ncbi:1-acyl-sn-glycerol-3-phosphate acyltransferase [Epilithonimonas hungarica]|uniref:1-acyl-sn-glycerol-3-phosphate acyltransferase n=1 Tax=Epilithonimonas hungarica TaxID=454006 RepID=UPI002784DF91|nr:1-acyl-sn-glycerol-3-phosphate acyltransferase [Epilithonimonas hungarica]MDP9955961.1 1-acyl-sn-glycerol-3-phosphate acyltransferase [Epilithonimonas hungarica]
MSKIDDIRYFYDEEVNGALLNVARHPMMKALMQFTFPNRDENFWLDEFKNIHSINDFQNRIISHTVRQILNKSSDGLSTSGFDKLDKNTAYLFISNHRDIVLDTSLLNLVLLDNGLMLTASAVGDNLIQNSFINILAKLTRNFLVQRDLPIREQLSSSKLLSEYIYDLLKKKNRSVWIAQREGRAKDGNDFTQQGILKMLAMAGGDVPLIDFFKSLKIVPLSISYEYDPTDALKLPQLMAKSRNETYAKDDNEDFKTILSGALGQKKHIHLHAGNILNEELDNIASQYENKNKQLQAIAQVIDDSIIKNYKLWPTKYIAYDLLHKTDRYSEHYTKEEKQLFERRLEMRIDSSDETLKNSFLEMYANPVTNKAKQDDNV